MTAQRATAAAVAAGPRADSTGGNHHPSAAAWNSLCATSVWESADPTMWTASRRPAATVVAG